MILLKRFQAESILGIGLWGIGLLRMVLSVFLPNLSSGKNWEEKKIRN